MNLHGTYDILSQGLTTVRTEERVELARWSSGNALLIGVVLAVAALYAVSCMYRKEGRGQLTRRLRWLLIGCRAAVLVLLGLIGLEPVIAKYIHRRIDAYTLVLVDRSASMALRDQYRMPEDAARVEKVAGAIEAEGVERAALAETVLGKGGDLLIKALMERNRVRVFEFSDAVLAAGVAARSDTGDATTQPANETTADEASPSRHAGAATNVGLAVRTAMDAVAGSPVAGIVVLTDGGFNQGEDPAVIARFLKLKNIPLHVVGVGDPSPPVNVRVADVSGPRTAFKNDPFSVTVRIEAEGVESEPIKVELLERRADSNEPAQVVETRTVMPGPGGRIPPVTFERKVAKPGVMSYVARAPTLRYEAVDADNQREVLPAVRILDDQMRVLIVAGAPSYDYRFLARLLERDKSVNLSTWLQSADVAAVRDGDTIITELPAEQEKLFEFDAVILIDPNPDQLDPTWGSMLATYVSEHGGGVLYAAGHKYAGKFFRSPKTTSIVEILPVVTDPEAEILLNDLGQYQTRAWPILIPNEAISDPILRLSDDMMENRVFWSMLEGVYWHYPVRREKPIATVLMRHSNPRMGNSFGPHVLLATQLVGAGRTAYLGFNSSARWRRDDETPFNRFWIQITRFLIEGKLLGGKSRALVMTAKDRYDIGESVVVTARAQDERFNPLQAPELELRVETSRATAVADGEGEAAPRNIVRSVPLAPIPGREGYYQGRFVADRRGACRLTLNVPGRGTAVSDATFDKEIVVSEPDIELREPAMRRPALQQLAQAAGGKYYEIDQAREVAGTIPDSSLTPPPIRERPRPLWDNSYVFGALLLALTLEWILRKKARLL